MFLDYVRGLVGVEIVLLIHMVGNIGAIYTIAGWMAAYVSRQKGYWSSIPYLLFASLVFGTPVAFGCSLVASKSSHAVTEVVVGIVELELLVVAIFTAIHENRTNLNEMKEKLDSFPGWRYWFDGDKQTQLVTALRVAITRDKSRNVPAISAGQIILLAAAANADTLRHLQEVPTNSPEGNYIAGRIFLWIASIVMLALINRIICERAMPGMTLMHHSLAHITRCGNEHQPALYLRIARWRNPEHRRLFQLADALEKCIYPVRRRVSRVDFDTVSTAFLALALAVRNEGARFSSERSLRPEVLSWMCITLAVNTNLVRSAKRVAALLPNEVSLVQPLPKSRVSDILGRINDALAQNTRAFVVLAAILVLAYYLATGNIAKLFEFLRSVAAS